MKWLLIGLMVELLLWALWLGAHLEKIKDEIVDALQYKQKEVLSSVFGKFSQGLREGETTTLDDIAQARKTAPLPGKPEPLPPLGGVVTAGPRTSTTPEDTTHERAGVFDNGDPK